MPLLPSQPFHSSSAGLAVASPSPTPSQPRGAASTGGLGTGPWPSGFAHIRRPRSRATASFPSLRSPGNRCQSFRPGWGQLCSRNPLPSGTCPARPVPDPAPAPHAIPPGPHSPRVDMAQAATAKREGEAKPAGRGEERIPRRAHGLARPPSPGRAHASRRTPARLAGSGQPGGQPRICRARRC